MKHEQKAALRAELRLRRAALSQEERARWSKSICEGLLPLLDGISTLLLFYPKGSEIDLLPVFHAARARGILCAFPRCGVKKGEMEFYYVNNLDGLEAGAYGIREPKEGAIPVTDLTGALMLVPALAFDREGHRIGYGGGYYDRYLQKHGVRSIGVIYEALLADSLPHEPHDVSVEILVTERRILSVKQ